MRFLKNAKLEIKIVSLLGLIIFTIIFLYSFIFSRHYKAHEERVIGQECISTLHSLDSSINGIIKHADDYSKMLLADRFIQSQMKSGDMFFDTSDQHEVISHIYAVLQFSDSVESVWLIDNQGHNLMVGGSANITYENEEYVKESYAKLKKSYGTCNVMLVENGKKDKLSLVRSYNNLENFQSLGIIGVDISIEALDHLISSILDLKEEEIIILNEAGNVIYSGGPNIGISCVGMTSRKLNDSQLELQENMTIDNENYLISAILDKESKWKIIRYMPVPSDRTMNEIVQFNIVSIIFIGILILLGVASISGMLTQPIQQLLACMKEVENGKMNTIVHKPYMKEFKELYKGYNHMVMQINRLIKETIERQRRIRQVEMNEIQEQMKPHFLYNTLDSIEALAMMGETDKVCQVVEALGDFYRKSVSGGREMLSLAEEFKMTKDYADIMRIRFGDTFHFELHLEEECKEYLIPKLTIQPLVENAFGHGIRAKKQMGVITVKGSAVKNTLHILVCDNGTGVPEEIVQELKENKEPLMGKSLGLRGTIERLRLIYGDGFSYEIRNKGCSEIHLYIDIDVLEGRKHGGELESYSD